MNRFRTAVAGLALVAVLGACSGGTAAGSSAADPAEADVTVTSVDMAFTETTVSAPAGEAFTMALVNEETMPHNIVIYTDDSKSEKLFEGEVVTDATAVYEIPALEPGEYYFICGLHPEMEGTLVIEG
jgi:plastocyanin